MQVALTCQHSVMSPVSHGVCGRELSTFHARMGKPPTPQRPNRPIALSQKDHMTISCCTVSRYGTMSDYTGICTDAAADEDRDETGEKRSRAATCRRPEWNWTTMRWQSGHESERRGVEARPASQRAASKLPTRRLAVFLRDYINLVVLGNGYQNLACSTTGCVIRICRASDCDTAPNWKP